MTFIGSKIVQKKLRILNTLPYRATGYRPKQPRAMPWAKSFCPFRACRGQGFSYRIP